MTADENALRCPLCQHLYNKKDRCPRRLLCGHTLCTACLAILIETSNRKCSTCRRPFLASSETQLPTDFSVYKKIAYKERDNEIKDSKVKATETSINMSRSMAEDQSSPTYRQQLVSQLSNDPDTITNTAKQPFKYQLPLIAKSPTSSDRLQPYVATQAHTGVEGYDEVDVPRERQMIEDINEMDIEEIPPPTPNMTPIKLPPSPISNFSIKTATSEQEQSVRATFSNEIPKPIKRSFNPQIPPVPTIRNSLAVQQAKEKHSIVNDNLSETYTPVMSTAKWKPIHTSSPLSKKKTTITHETASNLVNNVGGEIPQEIIDTEGKLIDQSIIASKLQTKRPTKRLAPNPNSLPADKTSTIEKVPTLLLIAEEAQLPQSHPTSLKFTLRSPRLQKLTPKQRAPNPKPVAKDLPTINSPLLKTAPNKENNEPQSEQTKSNDGASTIRPYSKRKAPMAGHQEISIKQEVTIDGLYTAASSQENFIASTEKNQENINLFRNYNEASNQVEKRSQTNIPVEINKLQMPYQSPKTINSGVAYNTTLNTLEQNPTKSTTVLKLNVRDDTLMTKSNDMNGEDAAARIPTPPSPSTLPVSSEEEDKTILSDRPPAKARFSGNENFQNYENIPSGSRTFNLRLGPMPYQTPGDNNKEESTKVSSVELEETIGADTSKYLHRVQQGVLQVGAVPSIQNNDTERKYTEVGPPKEHYRYEMTMNNDKHEMSIMHDRAVSSIPSLNADVGQVLEDSKKRYVSPLTEEPPHAVQLDSEILELSSNSNTQKHEQKVGIEKSVTMPPKRKKQEKYDAKYIHKDRDHASSLFSIQDTNNSQGDYVLEFQEYVKVEHISTKQKPSRISQDKQRLELNEDDRKSTDSDTDEMKAVYNAKHNKKPRSEESVVSSTRKQKATSTAYYSKKQEVSKNRRDAQEIKSSGSRNKMHNNYYSKSKDRSSKEIKSSGSNSEEEHPSNKYGLATLKSKHQNNADYFSYQEKEKSRGKYVKCSAYNNEETELDKSDINAKLQRARHQLKSTLYEPEFASPPTKEKQRLDRGDVKRKDLRSKYPKDTSSADSETGNQNLPMYESQSISEDTSSSPESSGQMPKVRTSDTVASSSEYEYSGNTDEININKKGMIMRYPPGSKPKHLERKDKMEINNKGMIVRYPSTYKHSQRQTIEKANERYKKSLTPVEQYNHKRSQETDKYKNKSAEPQYRNDSSVTKSNRNREEEEDVNNINLKLQRARKNLKSTLDDSILSPGENHRANRKQKKMEMAHKNKSDSDSELLKQRKQDLNTGRHQVKKYYQTTQGKRDAYSQKHNHSKSHIPQHDYNYDERLPKRFYYRNSLSSTHTKGESGKRGIKQSVKHQKYKEDYKSSSEDEMQKYVASESRKNKSKDTIMPRNLGEDEAISVSSEEFPTDIYADFKPEKYKNDESSDLSSDTVNYTSTKRKNKKRDKNGNDSFLKRSVTLTGSQYKPSFHYRPSSQVYTAELALVTNPDEEKLDEVQNLEREVAKMGVGQCSTHSILLDLYCKTCEQWICHECLDYVHRPPPEGHCQTIPSEEAVAELKESHAELFDSKIATLEHFKEELQKLLTNCETNIKEHENSIAQLSSRVLGEKMIIEGIENMKALVQQKWKQVEQWEDVLEANALRIGQSASSGDIADAMEHNKTNILVHVMQGMANDTMSDRKANSSRI
ncbi:hypothetical protein SK128_003940, partial [Halocaridina rubra]